ncbi:hypothetical protein [Thioalkalivibrio sp. ALE23]|uniref:hypothetical protein n=1 Tax=Thioalkalivibrio sp. ALE23 TaxID=1265495 RepID=UPI00035F2180|nr:hypothetical protein [Thioalkalivibrio sp. ALE23]
MSTNTYYRKTFTVTFYAKGADDLQKPLNHLVEDAETGDVVADTQDIPSEELSPLEAAYGLLAAGSEPDFFEELPDPGEFESDPEIRQMVEAAARVEDINDPAFDDALEKLQTNIGVTSGDVAAPFFSDVEERWPQMDERDRTQRVWAYIETEKAEAKMQAESED